MAKKITIFGWRGYPFIWNNDLSEIKFSFHNKGHFFGSMLIALFSSFLLSYGIWILWEIGDGLKPWFTKFKYNPKQPKWLNYFRENALYADGFSLQDAVIWDLGGALIGCTLNWLLVGIGINLSIL